MTNMILHLKERIATLWQT